MPLSRIFSLSIVLHAHSRDTPRHDVSRIWLVLQSETRKLKSIHKTQKLGFWINHIEGQWRHWGRYLTSSWPQNDLSIGKIDLAVEKYILLFYSSTLIELKIHLVRINHVLWRHHDVIVTSFWLIWLFTVVKNQNDHFWSKNDEEKSRNKIVEHENSTNRHYLANISMKQFIFGWFSRRK